METETQNPGADDMEAGDDTRQASEISTEAAFVRLKTWFRVDWDHSAKWREQARADFDFVAGDQWASEDRKTLEAQARPIITFNRTLAIVKSVAGIEINGRHETAFIPRGTEAGTVKANELLSSASQWMADATDAEDEQSEAFQDCIICGMGWSEPTLDYDEDPDGGYKETKLDPLEMVWDKAARAKNLKDARRVFRIQKMSLADARALAEDYGWSGTDKADLNATWALAAADAAENKPVEDRRHREGNTDAHEDDEVQLVHAQWIEKEIYYRVAAPNGIVNVDAAQFEQLQRQAAQMGVKLTFTKARRKVYKQALIGGVILGGIRPGLVKDRFTFQCITAERHRNKGTWFGLISMMRDPQMWANKWLSQTLHILNTTAKGGIIAESDAFEDVARAQDTYAQPDAITIVAPGAISKNKIMQKPGAGVPTAYVQLLEFAISSIRDVTGINMEILGMRDANQPGILEAQRKQAAMTILATLFDSLRRYRKNVGRVRLGIIQGYLADDRLIRLGTANDQNEYEVVKLAKDQTHGTFEVIVDDNPSSPNQKQETWATIQTVLPVFREMLTPEAVMTILEYSPLPSKLVDAFKTMAQKPDPEKDEAAAIAKAGQKAKVARDEAAAAKDKATAENTRLQGLLDLIAAGAGIPLPTAPPPAAPRGPLLEGEPWAVQPMGASSQNQLPMLPTVPTEPPPMDAAALAPSPAPINQ